MSDDSPQKDAPQEKAVPPPVTPPSLRVVLRDIREKSDRVTAFFNVVGATAPEFMKLVHGLNGSSDSVISSIATLPGKQTDSRWLQRCKFSVSADKRGAALKHLGLTAVATGFLFEDTTTGEDSDAGPPSVEKDPSGK